MIARGLAFDMLFGGNKLNAWDAIDEIYDSIGECKSCSNYRNDKFGKYCWWSLEDTPEDGYCHNFNIEVEGRSLPDLRGLK